MSAAGQGDPFPLLADRPLKVGALKAPTLE